MAKVIQMGNSREFRMRELEKELEALDHPDPSVRDTWISMAKGALRKYPGLPESTEPSLTIRMPASSTEDEVTSIQKEVQAFIDGLKSDFEQRQLEMLRDIILLQKELAEFREAHNKAKQ